MVITEQLCQDAEAAKRNRERIANQDSIHEYLVQEQTRNHWELGEPKPDSVIVGELLQVKPKHYHPFAVYRLEDE